MLRKRSERSAERRERTAGQRGGTRFLIEGLISCLALLIVAGCSSAEGLVELEDVMERNQLKYEVAQLSKAALEKRMKEIDDAYAEPRTPASVNLSLETSSLSISQENGYGALWRGARACAWLARHAVSRAQKEDYAFKGIAFGREAVKRASTLAESYYYLALNEGILLEMRDYSLRRFARDMKGHLLMARSLDPGLDHCGPQRALGRLMVKTRKFPSYGTGDYQGGIRQLEEARERCPTFGANHLELAEALIEGGEHARARAVLNEMVDLPHPPDHSADHQRWLARASELLSDLPGL